MFPSFENESGLFDSHNSYFEPWLLEDDLMASLQAFNAPLLLLPSSQDRFRRKGNRFSNSIQRIDHSRDRGQRLKLGQMVKRQDLTQVMLSITQSLPSSLEPQPLRGDLFTLLGLL